MWKKDKNSIFFGLLSLGFLSVAFADVKIVESIPLYILDYMYLCLLPLVSILFWKNTCNIKEFFKSKKVIFCGLLLICAGVSFLANSPDLTGLGQLKSWFLLPAVTLILSAFLLQEDCHRDKKIILLWLGGISVLVATVVPYVIFGTLTFDNRLQGPFSSPNFLGFFLFPGVLLCQYFFAGTREKWLKGSLIVLGFICIGLLYMTHSFGSWLALLAATLWSVKNYLHDKRVRIVIGSVGIILTLFLCYEIKYDQKIEGLFQERSSLASRITIWQVSQEIIKNSPVFGIGVGNFQQAYLEEQKNFSPYLEWAVPQPHNLFLALWLQTGILGFVLFLFLLTYIFFPQHQKKSKERLLLEALFVGFLIYGIFDTPLFGNALAFVWWLIFSLLLFPQKKSS